MIRHGKTEGNIAKKYIGATDQSLCMEGMLSLEPEPWDILVPKVYVSPLIRTKQTAELLFPSAKQQVIKEFAEMDFGEFEDKNYIQLEDDMAYKVWINSDCEEPCPGGECKKEFIARCGLAFLHLVERETEDIVMVVHGGTIMSICYCFVAPQKEYFHWHIDNGERLTFQWNGKNLEEIH